MKCKLFLFLFVKKLGENEGLMADFKRQKLLAFQFF